MELAELSVEEAQRRLSEFRPVDVRAEHEWRGPLGHIEGALWLPLPELAERAKELPQDAPLLLVCRSGARSARACETLRTLGMGPAVNLAGGMIAWNRARLPVERPAPRSLAEWLELVTSFAAQLQGQSAADVRERLERRLAPLGQTCDALDPGGARAVLDALIEDFAAAGSPPPDLELSARVFRDWVAGL